MKAVTIKQVMAWNPCYERTEIEQWFNGRETVTPNDVVEFQREKGAITQADVIWFLLHNEFLTDEQMHLLACDFAEVVVHLCDDSVSQAAIDAKRAWVRGEITDSDLATARATQIKMILEAIEQCDKQPHTL